MTEPAGNAGFLFLAGVAVVATLLLWFFMPETRAEDGADANLQAPAT